jgi:FkbM family methyltransferase
MAKRRLAAQVYFSLLPFFSHWLPRKARQQIRNSIHAVRWPEITLRPRTVTLGRSTKVRLRPHFDEFDFEALLGPRLDYEREVFEFLEPRICDYDVVIEVGANVGVFTTFVANIALATSRALKLYAFEPSRTAYARLLDNLQLNKVDDVQTFNCAVGDRTGIVDFFEPQGHITNGSFNREFALRFSNEVRRTTTLVVNADLLNEFVGDSDRLLIKIDVEGAEPVILAALERLVRRLKPDLLIEVLPLTTADLNRIPFLTECGYKLLHLTGGGAVERTKLSASEWRDYFLSAATPDQPARTQSFVAAAQ